MTVTYALLAMPLIFLKNLGSTFNLRKEATIDSLSVHVVIYMAGLVFFFFSCLCLWTVHLRIASVFSACVISVFVKVGTAVSTIRAYRHRNQIIIGTGGGSSVVFKIFHNEDS